MENDALVYKTAETQELFILTIYIFITIINISHWREKDYIIENDMWC